MKKNQTWLFKRDEIDRLFQVNVHGIINILRAFLPNMMKRKADIVVNFSSGVEPRFCSESGALLRVAVGRRRNDESHVP